MNLKFLNLQNGSDIRGVAMDGIPSESINITVEHVKWIAESFAHFLANKLSKPINELSISVGIDSRLSGPELKSSILNSFSSLGVTSYDCGIASTPSMFMSTIFTQHQCDGSIMITASHLPFNRNGMKFFTKDGGLENKNIKDILVLAETLYLRNENFYLNGKIVNYRLIDVYSDYLVHKIRKGTHDLTPLEGLRIIVDAGNGAGGFFAKRILRPLGADITGSQFLEPDGMFPNHIPNPEDNEAMLSIQKATIDNNADLGIIFDTDVDRAAIVDCGGKIINRNLLIALMSVIVLDDCPRTTIVTDSVTSDGLKEFIESKGGVHHRFKRGYKNVINESIRLNSVDVDSALAIETSGHGALKENFFLDDGAYTITKIIIKLAKMKSSKMQLGDLIKDLKEPAEASEFRVKILEPDFQSYGLKIIEDLKEYAINDIDLELAPDNHEGIRVQSKRKDIDGWFLLRLSLHDPILPINIESNNTTGVGIMKTILKDFLLKYNQLDLTTI